MPAAPTPIDALPATPDPTQPQTTFDINAFNWSSALPVFRTQVNAIAANVFANATEAASSAGTATAAAGAAEDSASAAIAAAAVAEAAVASLPDGTINDSITSPTDTWSSNKISAELDAVDPAPFASPTALAQVQAAALSF